MDNNGECFDVFFDPVDANRIRVAAKRLGMSDAEFVRWATQRAIEAGLDEWVGEEE